MKPFVYSALPSRVIFGSGTLSQLSSEIQRLGCSKALVLTTPQQVDAGDKVVSLIGDLAVGLYTNATMHTPTHVTDDAIKTVEEKGVDCVVAVGGGSTIGLGKAIALRTDLPQIVIPTTYAGSEATPIIGQTENNVKTTQKTLKVLPEVVIYDVTLTLTLPAQMTITSGMNAIAHAVEALYSSEANPVINLLAEQGVASIAKALPIIHKNPQDLEARSDALYGAWACGTCLGAVGMSLHHKLCHTLGGTFNMPHAETHTVILPHAIAYNAPHISASLSILARALNTTPSNVPGLLFDMSKDLGAPYSLKQLGFKEEDVEKAADIAAKAPYPNPAPLERERLVVLLRNAWEGKRPAVE